MGTTIMSKQRAETLAAYVFLAPALLGFALFMFFPFMSSILLSFTEWDMISGIRGIRWIGLDGFIELFQSSRFYTALKNNLLITAVCVPVTLLLSLVIAYLLNEKVYFKKTIRVLYFVPYICNIIAVSAVWKSLFRTPDGPVNQMIAAIGVENLPRWFADRNLAIIPIITLTIWTGLGYDMIIYMAALQGVPKELYEAGEMDGAVGVKRFLYITLPALSPTTYFLVVTRMIHSFQIFSAIKVITEGGPGSATTVLVYEIYREAFSNYKFGYASANAVVLFVIIMAITLIQQQLQKKWVTY
jgi:multiple sugar transport system permease protein